MKTKLINLLKAYLSKLRALGEFSFFLVYYFRYKNIFKVKMQEPLSSKFQIFYSTIKCNKKKFIGKVDRNL